MEHRSDSAHAHGSAHGARDTVPYGTFVKRLGCVLLVLTGSWSR